jgi:hypothetical protein
VATRQDKLTIKSGSGSFVSNVQELRRRARTHIEQGAVIEGYKANVDTHRGADPEGLVAERIVIESYSEMIRFLGNDDRTTRGMLEGTLADEEDHANDLRTLIESMGKDER